jgi:tyrosine-protein kinase Etk/Wzc
MNPLSILQSAEFNERLELICTDFDWVIMDSPPLIPFGDAAALAAQSDGIVFVTRSGVTPKAALAESLKSMDQSKIVATILNAVNLPAHKYYYKYYTSATPHLSSPASHHHPALPITKIIRDGA